MTYQIRFYGQVKKESVTLPGGLTSERSLWTGGELIKAMAYDTPVPGYSTFNTNCLRLWSALPSFEAASNNNTGAS